MPQEKNSGRGIVFQWPVFCRPSDSYRGIVVSCCRLVFTVVVVLELSGLG